MILRRRCTGRTGHFIEAVKILMKI